MKQQYELDKDTIGIVQVDEINYIVLRKERMIDNTNTYKVQWYNSQTNSYSWTNYDLSFANAQLKFMEKILSNIEEKKLIPNNINQHNN